MKPEDILKYRKGNLIKIPKSTGVTEKFLRCRKKELIELLGIAPDEHLAFSSNQFEVVILIRMKSGRKKTENPQSQWPQQTLRIPPDLEDLVNAEIAGGKPFQQIGTEALKQRYERGKK
jgi:hypothetical protein